MGWAPQNRNAGRGSPTARCIEDRSPEISLDNGLFTNGLFTIRLRNERTTGAPGWPNRPRRSALSGDAA